MHMRHDQDLSLCAIAIYAVHDGSELVGFSFDESPGNAELHVHTRINSPNLARL